MADSTVCTVLLASAPVPDEAALPAALKHIASAAVGTPLGGGRRPGTAGGVGGASVAGEAEGGSGGGAWAVGQLLPWRALRFGADRADAESAARSSASDGGHSDGAGAHGGSAAGEEGQVQAPLSLQQLLWRGLLFPHTRVQTVGGRAGWRAGGRAGGWVGAQSRAPKGGPL